MSVRPFSPDDAAPRSRPEEKSIDRILGNLVNAIFLAMVVLPPAFAVSDVSLDPTLPFDLLIWIALGAMALGIFFATSGAHGGLLHPLAILLGFGGILYLITQILPGAPPAATFGERLEEITRQLIVWIQTIRSGGQGTNNLLFLLLLSLVAWLLGYFGAWAVFRERSAWWPVTVGATALILVLATFPRVVGYMLIELTGALLLIGRMNFQNRQELWKAIGVRQAAGIGRQAFQVSLLLALAVVALTWLAPAVLVSREFTESLGFDRRPWEQAQAEFNRLFGGLRGQSTGSISGFGRDLSLHGTFHLTDTPVLRIAVTQPEYWRAIVYDRYTGHGWTSSDPIDQRVLAAGSDILRPADVRRTDLVQQVTVLVPRGPYLIGAAQPTIFDRPVEAEAYHDAAGGEIDLVAARAVDPIKPNTTYAVVSKVSEASQSELRQANQTYPDEIRQRYLTLPPVPQRVHQLARQLTASAANPYDKAIAVEAYLRAMPYSLDLPAPPPDRDGVDYFLFDVKTGYCDYFASSMAVLLRSVGVPARVVSGYATGSQQADGTYLIRDSDSHSWTEVYFPPYGWIPFEPSGSWQRFDRGDTGSGAMTPTPLARPEPAANPAQDQAEMTPTPTPTPSPMPPPSVGRSSTPPAPAIDSIFQALVPILLIIAALGALAALLWYLWEKDLRNLPPSVAAYLKMARLTSWLGIGPRPSETPREFGDSLARALPETGSGASQIADEYARYRFSRTDPGPSARAHLRWRVIRNALLRRIGRLQR